MSKKEVDNNIVGKYFTITPKLAYSSPVYIHSHTRSLNKAVANNQKLKSLRDLLTELKNEKQRILGLINQTYNILNDKKNELISMKFPTENGKPKKLTKILRELGETVEEASKKFQDWHDHVIILQYDHHHSIGYWVAEKASTTEFHDNIIDGFYDNLKRKFEKKTGKEFLLTKEKIAKMSFDHLSKELEKLEYDVTADQLAESILKLRDFFEVVQKIITGIPEIKKIYQHDIDSLNYSSSVKQALKAIVSGRSYFSKLGTVFELAHQQSKTKNVNKKQSRREKANKAPKVRLYKYSMEIVSENNKELDKLTTDVKTNFDNLQKSIMYGMSLKLNSTRFKKDKNVLTEKDMGSLYPLLQSLENISKDNRFRYYVLNVQALSLVRFNEKYSDYQKAKEEGKVPSFSEPVRQKSLVYIIEDIELLLSQMAFIKSVVGSLYDEDVVDPIAEAKGLPVILSTPAQDYWTADIVKYMLDIISKSDGDNKVIMKFITNYTPYDPYRGDKVNALRTALINLYIAKAENALKKFGTEVSYDDLEQNFAEEGQNRYAELKSDAEVLRILKEVNSLNLMVNPKRMNNLISKKWNIRFDYSEIK